MQYDAVLFDFDGVVVETPSSRRLSDSLRRTYEELGQSEKPGPTSTPNPATAPASTLVREFVHGDFPAIAERCRSLGIETDTFCSRAARELVRTQLDAVERGLRSVYDDITAVRSIELPVGIVSDNHPTVVSSLLDRFGLRALFETIYGCPLTADGLARRKPDPRNIEDAMAELEADSALYVGDRSVDVQAAHNAGIDAVLLSRSDSEASTKTESDLDPDHEVGSLAELPTVLGSTA
ncbi:HAD family hydrolase [Natrialba sp. PRR66]|uniref:HAD family hydrolase n=1 Tax=Natrialba sp. PRR66 TaxID=3098146 RepID=UPI002B1E4835|nr:HAD family hydrolase [Natrialba sp. PRR66]